MFKFNSTLLHFGQYLPVKFWFLSDNGFLINFILNSSQSTFHFYDSLNFLNFFSSSSSSLRPFIKMSEHLKHSSHTKKFLKRYVRLISIIARCIYDPIYYKFLFQVFYYRHDWLGPFLNLYNFYLPNYVYVHKRRILFLFF